MWVNTLGRIRANHAICRASGTAIGCLHSSGTGLPWAELVEDSRSDHAIRVAPRVMMVGQKVTWSAEPHGLYNAHAFSLLPEESTDLGNIG